MASPQRGPPCLALHPHCPLHSPARTGSGPAGELVGVCPMADGGEWGTCLNLGLGGDLCPLPPQELYCWRHGGFQISGSLFWGEESWVFDLGPFSDWGLWHCQCSAGILGQCHEFARVGLSTLLGCSCCWLRSSFRLCLRVCFLGSAS